MNKKLVCFGLFFLGLASVSTMANAQSGLEVGSINAILEDNSLRDAATRYVSVFSYFFPEEATRLGFSNGNNLLNDRSANSDEQAQQALEAVVRDLDLIDLSNLSENKKSEYHLLKQTLQSNLWQLQQNRLTKNPLYYAQALDAVYDLLLVPQSNLRTKRLNLLGRISALPLVAQQAQENLEDVSPHLARLAMEKAYYAYISFDEVAKLITEGPALTNDSNDASKTEGAVQRAKGAIRQLFDLFKQLSQQESATQDFRLGEEAYATMLKDTYQITEKSASLSKVLEKQFDQAQHELASALEPFALSAEDEEVTVVEDLNEIPFIQHAQKETGKDAKPQKAKKPEYVPPTANQFYAVATQLESPFTLNDKVNEEINKQASAFMAQLVKDKVLPSKVAFKVQPLPAYFAYQQAYKFFPAYNAFFLRVPTGNELAKKEMLKQDFNEPAYKLFISQALVPGTYYQNSVTKSNVKRVFGTPLLANGWETYALNIANDQHYFLTDEEHLFFSFQNYLRAITALLDKRLHTQEITYEEAQNFLVENNGFTSEQAQQLLFSIIANPGQAVSYVWGNQVWEKAAAPYQKKAKNNGQVTSLLLQAGNVSPDDLTTELKQLSKNK